MWAERGSKDAQDPKQVNLLGISVWGLQHSTRMKHIISKLPWK